jgi:hypothetical protein
MTGRGSALGGPSPQARGFRRRVIGNGSREARLRVRWPVAGAIVRGGGTRTLPAHRRDRREVERLDKPAPRAQLPDNLR